MSNANFSVDADLQLTNDNEWVSVPVLHTQKNAVLAVVVSASHSSLVVCPHKVSSSNNDVVDKLNLRFTAIESG